MTQVDSEAPSAVYTVGSGCDRKIAAEEPGDPDIPVSAVVDYPPDFPPESFWLSKDAEFDWFDRNAFLDRKESIKGNSNSTNLNPNINFTGNSSSLQFLKSKPAIISLPQGQKTSYVDSKRRNCKLAKIWLFPKRLDSISKEPTVVSMVEPSSPKVSCIGRVRSKSCPSRRKSDRPASERRKSATRNEKTGLMSRIKSLFRFDCYGGSKVNKSPSEINAPTEYSAPGRNNVTEPEAVAHLPAKDPRPRC